MGLIGLMGLVREPYGPPPEKMMEKPTPALPKGGSILFFCPSVRVGVGFYLPSLGEGLGVM